MSPFIHVWVVTCILHFSPKKTVRMLKGKRYQLSNKWWLFLRFVQLSGTYSKSALTNCLMTISSFEVGMFQIYCVGFWILFISWWTIGNNKRSLKDTISIDSVEAVYRHFCVPKNGLINHRHVRFHVTKSVYLPLHTTNSQRTHILNGLVYV